MTASIDTVASSQEISPLKEKFSQTMLDFLGGAGVMCLELWRTKLVPSSTPFLNPEYNPHHKTLLNRPDNPALYDTLQNMGDIYEGYFLPFIANNLLLYTIPKLSNKARLAASMLLSDAFIISVESGILSYNQQPDYADIPAALIGNLIYLGVNWASRNKDVNIVYHMMRD